SQTTLCARILLGVTALACAITGLFIEDGYVIAGFLLVVLPLVATLQVGVKSGILWAMAAVFLIAALHTAHRYVSIPPEQVVTGWEIGFFQVFLTGLALGIAGSFSRVAKQSFDSAVESWNQLSQIVDSLHAGVLLIDADGVVRLVNRRWIAMFGLEGSPADFQDQGITHRLLPLMNREFAQHVDLMAIATSALRRGESVRDLRIRLTDSRTLDAELVPLLSDSGVPQQLWLLRDVTHLQRQADRLAQKANRDDLTGLLSRGCFFERVDQALLSDPTWQAGFAVVFIDLDDFKGINDSCGHATGDLVLKAVSTRLQEIFRSTDIIARLGGDEFTIACPGVRGEADAQLVAERLLDTLRKPLSIKDLSGHVTSISVGVARYPRDGLSTGELLHRADAAMYRAKRQGGGFALVDRRERILKVDPASAQGEADAKQRAGERDKREENSDVESSSPDAAGRTLSNASC
ncbi:MAG: diguanylate cyclase, partial [Myxococcales bacterium]|nr:diguanylate cyclase [Myxococcales bacterium]